MSYSVLVVDDEDLTLRTVSRGLRQEGFEVFTAASGEDALSVFAQEKPDLTLLDIVLPGIDGVEVLRRLKQANPAAIILMMSAYHMVDRAVEAMKLGAYDYLIKPFHLADMIATLNRAGEMLALRVRVRDDVEQARGRYKWSPKTRPRRACSKWYARLPSPITPPSSCKARAAPAKAYLPRPSTTPAPALPCRYSN